MEPNSPLPSADRQSVTFAMDDGTKNGKLHSLGLGWVTLTSIRRGTTTTCTPYKERTSLPLKNMIPGCPQQASYFQMTKKMLIQK